MATVYLIASGKGGTGKSTLTASLGMALAESGLTAVIVDTDIGLRSQDTLLNLENQIVYDLVDVVRQNCPLESALLSVPDHPSLKLLPAAQFARVKEIDGKKLRQIIRSLRKDFDYILIDCPAGVERGFRNVMNTGICQAILVTTPDDVSLRDVERAASLLLSAGFERPKLIVNRLDSELVRTGEMLSARAIAAALDLPLLGEIPEDPAVYRALLRHTTFLRFDCEARSAVIRIADRLKGQMPPFPEYGKKKAGLLSRLFRHRLKEVNQIDDL